MPSWIKPVAAILLVLYVVFHLFSLKFRDRPNLGWTGRTVVTLTSPLQAAGTAVVNGMGDVWRHYVALTQTSERYDALLKERDGLRRRLLEVMEMEAENIRLRKILELHAASPLEMVTAERQASGASSFERTIRVGRGQRDGVSAGAAVLHPQGVVGQVLDVFPRSSDILLLVDPSSAVDVVSQRSRARGLLRGAGPQELKFVYLPGTEDLKAGDEVVTSGLDGLYPAGWPVGVVTDVHKEGRQLFLSARVRPHVDFARLEEVDVVVGVKK